MTRNYRVTRNPEGGWDAKAEGAKGASSHHRTQAQAAAKRYSGNHRGGEVRIHRPDGTIRNSDMVSPARHLADESVAAKKDTDTAPLPI
jgi:Uncharacterized protein conserved in bacteria (DUF2188)